MKYLGDGGVLDEGNVSWGVCPALCPLSLFPVPPRYDSHPHVPATIQVPIVMESPP